MELEEAIKELKEHIDKVKQDYIISDYCETCGNVEAIETVLQALENSIPTEVIEKKIEELNENQRLEEGGVLNREDIEVKEERGAIRVLNKLLEGK